MAVPAMVIAALAGAAFLCWILSRIRDLGVRDLHDIAQRMGTYGNQPIFPARTRRGEPGLYLGVLGVFIIGPQCLIVKERRRARLTLDQLKARLWQIRQALKRRPNQYFVSAVEAATLEIAEMKCMLTTGGSAELLRIYNQALRLEQDLSAAQSRLNSIAELLDKAQSLIQEVSARVPDPQGQEALGLPQIAEQVSQWFELCRSFSNAKHFAEIESRLREAIQMLTECVVHLRGGEGGGTGAEGAIHDDPYCVLGVAQGVTVPEIKDAYRKKAAAYHPDKVREVSDDPEVQARLREWFTREMAKINAAYAELKKQGAVT